ncbi:MAG: chalcone isomerase family protein [Thiomonas sp.]|uniref:chalcone isomerase family protein n=1 Tax=Thiomonas sp. TaxID=2047785 RepID=UPI002A36000F|nr:chalcone isomerase family protein [Thiomonas sp.]MDY0331297.1 chalcone isomerase family protein [Thiomonas sp.]
MDHPADRPLRTFGAAITLLVALTAEVFMPSAQALTLHGVDIAPQVEVGGKTLTLNGAGTRYVFVFKVYTAALYLPQKSAQPQAIYAMTGPKELKLTMLRDVSGKELGDKLNEGIKNNLSPQEFSAFIPSLAQLGGLFAQKSQIKTGETVTIREIPGKGSTIAIDGVPSGGVFTDPQFFNSMLKIWLGKEPAEDRLKRALLGDEGDSN